MTRLILVRLGLGLLTLGAISIIVFGAVNLLPGDLAEEILGQNRTPETVAALRRELGLDRPVLERYLAWVAASSPGISEARSPRGGRCPS